MERNLTKSKSGYHIFKKDSASVHTEQKEIAKPVSVFELTNKTKTGDNYDTENVNWNHDNALHQQTREKGNKTNQSKNEASNNYNIKMNINQINLNPRDKDRSKLNRDDHNTDDNQTDIHQMRREISKIKESDPIPRNKSNLDKLMKKLKDEIFGISTNIKTNEAKIQNIINNYNHPPLSSRVKDEQNRNLLSISLRDSSANQKEGSVERKKDSLKNLHVNAQKFKGNNRIEIKTARKGSNSPFNLELRSKRDNLLTESNDTECNSNYYLHTSPTLNSQSSSKKIFLNFSKNLNERLKTKDSIINEKDERIKILEERNLTLEKMILELEVKLNNTNKFINTPRSPKVTSKSTSYETLIKENITLKLGMENLEHEVQQCKANFVNRLEEKDKLIEQLNNEIRTSSLNVVNKEKQKDEVFQLKSISEMKIRSLNKEVLRLEKALLCKEEEMKKFQSDYDLEKSRALNIHKEMEANLKKEIEKIEYANNKLLEYKQRELNEMQNQIHELKVQVRSRDEEVTQLKKSIQRVEYDNNIKDSQVKEDELKEMKEKFLKREGKLEELVKELEKRRSEYESLFFENQKKQGLIEVQRKDNELLKGSVDELNNQLKHLEEECANLNKQIEDILREDSEKESRLALSEELLTIRINECEDLKIKLKEKQNEINDLKSQNMENTKELAALLVKFNGEQTKMASEIKDLGSKLEVSKASLITKEEENYKLTQDVDELKRAEEKLKKEIDKLRMALAEEIKEEEQLNLKLIELNKVISEVNKQLNDKETEIISINHKIEAEKINLKQEIDKLEKQTHSFSQEINSLNSQVSSLKEEKEKLSKENQVLVEEVHRKRQEITNLEENNLISQEDKIQLEKTLTAKIRELEPKLTDLMKADQINKEKIDTLNQTLEEERIEYMVTIQNNQLIISEKDEKIKEYQENALKLNEEKKNLNDEIINFQNKLNLTKESFDLLKKDKDDKESTFEIKLQEGKLEISRLKEENKTSNLKNEELEHLLLQARTENIQIHEDTRQKLNKWKQLDYFKCARLNFTTQSNKKDVSSPLESPNQNEKDLIIQELTIQLNKLQAEYNQIAEQLKESEQLNQDKIAEVQEEILMKESELRIQNFKYKELVQTNIELKGQVKERRQSFLKVEHQIESSFTFMIDSCKANKIIKSKNKAVDYDTFDDLLEKLKLKEIEVKSLKEEKLRLEKEKKQMTSSIEELEQTFRSKEKNLTNTIKVITKELEDNTKLIVDRASSESDDDSKEEKEIIVPLEEIKRENSELKIQINDLRLKLDESNKAEEQVLLKLNHLTIRCEELKKECEDYKSINLKLLNNVEELKNKKDSMLDSLNDEFKSDITEEENEGEANDQEDNAISIRENPKYRDISERSKSHTKQSKKLKFLDDSMEKSSLGMSSFINMGGLDENELKKYNERIEKYKKVVEKYKQNYELLFQQSLILKEEIKNLQNKLETFKSFNGSLENYDELFSSLGKVLMNYKPKKKELEEATKKLKEYLTLYQGSGDTTTKNSSMIKEVNRRSSLFDIFGGKK